MTEQQLAAWNKAITALERWTLYSFAEGPLPELASMLKSCCEETDAVLALLRSTDTDGWEGIEQRLEASMKLQDLTLSNQIRWMRKHDDLLALIQSIRDWKSPDGVLEVKDLHWFKTLPLPPGGKD